MFCEKCPGKIHKVGDGFIVRIRPIARKFKAVTCLFALAAPALAMLLDMGIACGVGLILGMSAV
jgi:hypothetical protein